MKFSPITTAALSTLLFGGSNVSFADAQNMVKMCLFYNSPSGHARSDPIISQTCPSDHAHTFYGPQQFHPMTGYTDLRSTSPSASSTPFIENQSLYWHPTIYEVTNNLDGSKKYTKTNNILTSPYYRWDNSVLPRTEAFPPGFRMITHSNDPGANLGGETGSNMLVECCDVVNGAENCETYNSLVFPTKTCDFLGIALAMPTCWDGRLDDPIDHKSHMAYTVDGTVAGACPVGYNRRLPQIQIFVRINNYRGGTYVLADETNIWHVDFFNGWQEGTLQNIVDNCPVIPQEAGDYNPPCNCDEFMTPNPNPATEVCEVDVRELIFDEPVNEINGLLPRGTCQGPQIVPKSWTGDMSPLDCAATAGGPNPVPAPIPNPTQPPVPTPTRPPVPNPTRTPIANPTQPPIPNPTQPPVPIPTQAPVQGLGSNIPTQGCIDSCWDTYDECDIFLDSICGDSVFLPPCHAICDDRFNSGAINEDQHDACFDMCFVDQGRCYEQQDVLCVNARHSCISLC